MGEKARAECVAGTGRVFDFNVFIDTNADDTAGVGGDGALAAVGDDDGRDIAR